MIQVLTPLLAAGLLEGAGPAVRRFPAVVDEETALIPSAIVLRVPMKTYGVNGTPLEAFTGPQLDEREQAMAAFLNSIRTSTVSAFRDLYYMPPAGKPEPHSNGHAAVLASPNFEQTIALYRKLFNQFQKVRLECRIPVEDGDLFIWKAESPDGWKRVGSLALLVEGKIRIVHWVSSNYPIEVFIKNCLGRLPAESLDRLALAPSERRKFFLDLDAKGSAIEFDGQYLDVEAGDAAASLPLPAQVFRDAIVKLRAGDVDGYLASFTDASRTTLRKWYATMSKETFETYRKYESRPRYIKFILNADPVFMIFYAPSAGNAWPGEQLGYRYIFRTGDGFKLGNANFGGFLDAVLHHSKYLPKFMKGVTAAQDRGQAGSVVLAAP